MANAIKENMMFGFTGKLKKEIAALKSEVEYLKGDKRRLEDRVAEICELDKRNKMEIEGLRQHAKDLLEANREKEKTIEELLNKVKNLTPRYSTENNNKHSEAFSAVKNLTNTVIEKDKIIEALSKQLSLDKVYSVKDTKVIVFRRLKLIKTRLEIYDNVNQAAKSENVDVSWLTKKLKSGNGVAIVNGIQFVLVRV